MRITCNAMCSDGINIALNVQLFHLNSEWAEIFGAMENLRNCTLDLMKCFFNVLYQHAYIEKFKSGFEKKVNFENFCWTCNNVEGNGIMKL
jgi:hypothetical protein